MDRRCRWFTCAVLDRAWLVHPAGRLVSFLGSEVSQAMILPYLIGARCTIVLGLANSDSRTAYRGLTVDRKAEPISNRAAKNFGAYGSVARQPIVCIKLMRRAQMVCLVG